MRSPGPLRFQGLGRLIAVACACLFAGAATAQTSPVVRTSHVAVDLAPETASAAPGRTLIVALHQVIAPGWHTYWRNPGDAGQPTAISWTLPAGWRAGPIQWPAPERFLAGPIMNYVYTREAYLPVALSVPADARAGQTVPLKAAVTWLVCKDICIPEQATVTLNVPVDATSPQLASGEGVAVAATLAALPRAAGLSGRFVVANGAVRLTVAGPALKGLATTDAYFFPYDGTALEQASQQQATRTSHGVVLTLPAGYAFGHGAPPSKLDGVLSIGGKGFEIHATASGSAAVGAAMPPASDAAQASAAASVSTPTIQTRDSAASPRQAQGGDIGLFAALVLAFAGGLVLNLMPCVFPVLSMKAAALARHLDDPVRARGEGLGFLAGVVVSFLVLAGLLIAARSAGQAAGWGWQLQSPAVVGVLTLVLFAAGLNLSGVFEAGLSLQNVGSGAAARSSGMAGSVLTGVLAVVVAAPCTAPFMATAMGWALTQPPVAALSVFLALALGLAAPFVAIAFSPGLLRRFPRPGPWMEGLRKLLAFPMYAAAAWFAWVFAIQAGDAALIRLLAAVVAAGFAAFCWGVGQRARRSALPRAAAVLGALSAIGAVVGVMAAPAGVVASTRAAPAGPGAPQPWSQARVDSLRAAGHPVFVDFTAAWCVTCQVNERTALAGHDVADAFARTGAVYLKADWTRADPAITAALTAQGRSGVPLYLVYGRKDAHPAILPQLLTGAAVVHALEAAARA